MFAVRSHVSGLGSTAAIGGVRCRLNKSRAMAGKPQIRLPMRLLAMADKDEGAPSGIPSTPPPAASSAPPAKKNILDAKVRGVGCVRKAPVSRLATSLAPTSPVETCIISFSVEMTYNSCFSGHDPLKPPLSA